jgi:hypothetical protein
MIRGRKIAIFTSHPSQWLPHVSGFDVKMGRFKLIAAISLVYFLLRCGEASFCRNGQQEAHSATSLKGQIEAASRVSAHPPWTHAQYCDYSPDDKKFCVLTNSTFAFGQGISIIARPAVALNIADAMKMHHLVERREEDLKYEAMERPGRGVGLYVKPDELIKAGEIIMIDYPTLLIAEEAVDTLDSEIKQELQWIGVLQLSELGRHRTRHLAQSMGVGVDEIDNVVATNSFRQSHGDAFDLAILPEIAVSDNSRYMRFFSEPNIYSETKSWLPTEVGDSTLRDVASH